MKAPVIKVVANLPQGYMIINEEDFDERKHRKYVESKETLLDKAAKLGAKVDKRMSPERIQEAVEKAEKGLIDEDEL